MHDPTLVTTDARPKIRFDRHLPSPPAVVWRALTEREELNGWFPCDILTDEWKVGASLKFVFRDGEWHDLAGTVLECDEPRTLEFTWADETLRFELTEEDGGTRLVFTDELDPGIAARNAAGWVVCLDRLEGRTSPEESWKGLFERYSVEFAPTLGAQEGPPERP
jgi:uncharacterized protein YndB with AHSA1/START domain